MNGSGKADWSVVFDMDGVLIDSEVLWDEVITQVAHELGGNWTAETQSAMIGLGMAESCIYMHEHLGFALPPEDISALLDERVQHRYGQGLEATPGAVDLLRALVKNGVPVALASSSSRRLVDAVLEQTHLAPYFSATVAGDEVAHGKPAPEIYFAALAGLGATANRSVAVEDSGNGIRSAAAAGMHVIAVMNADYPVAPDALCLCGQQVKSLTDLSPAQLHRAVVSRSPDVDAVT